MVNQGTIVYKFSESAMIIQVKGHVIYAVLWQQQKFLLPFGLTNMPQFHVKIQKSCLKAAAPNQTFCQALVLLRSIHDPKATLF